MGISSAEDYFQSLAGETVYELADEIFTTDLIDSLMGEIIFNGAYSCKDGRVHLFYLDGEELSDFDGETDSLTLTGEGAPADMKFFYPTVLTRTAAEAAAETT